METRAHYVAVGGFVLTVVLLAFVAVLWVGRAELSTQYTRYDIFFTGTVTGLTEGAAVQYNGIKVGRVGDIRIDPDNVEQIRVTAEIDSRVVIKVDAVAGLETNLLSGVSTILITGGTQEAAALTLLQGQTYPVIQSRRSRLERVYSRVPRLIERIIELTDSLNQVVNERNRKNIAETLENLRTASTGLAESGQQIGEISGNAKETLAEVRLAVRGIEPVLRNAESLVRNLDQSYSANGGLKDQLAATIADYDRLAKSLIDTNQRMQAVIQEARPGVRDFLQRTVGQINDLVGETRHLVSGLTRLAAELERDPTRILYGDRREGYRPR